MNKKFMYIRIPAIYNKIKWAEQENVPIYISAPVGYGKTAAVEYYYRDIPTVWITGKTGKLNRLHPQEDEGLNSLDSNVVIIDDVSWIRDDESRDYIVELIKRKDIHIVMIGRAKVPDWLQSCCIMYHFIVANEYDLTLNVEMTGDLLEAANVHISPQHVAEIAKDTQGYALFIVMIAYQLQNRSEYNESIRQHARVDTFQYYNEVLFARWSPEMCEMLLAASCFESFNIDLLDMALSSNNSASCIKEAMEVGDFLTKHEDGSYTMRPMLQKYLEWKRLFSGSKENEYLVYERAGIYYEMQGNMEKALEFFDKADRKQEISRILTRNAKLHPGTGHYFETRKYYLELPEEKIESSAVLMAGISMLYSLMLQPELSESWYDRLCEYEKSRPRGSREKKEAKQRIVYLDIALPHRGTVKMIDILKKAAVLIMDRGMPLPEFSVTSNLPSIMNGGKDFCNWSKTDRELARNLKIPVELVLRKWGAGLVNISLAESLFEKGSRDYYETMTLLSSGYTKADLAGKIEMCFVATAVMCRVHLCRNQMSVARSQLEDFKNKSVKQDATRLIPNIRTMETGFDLLEGNTTKVIQWMTSEAPHEFTDFYILDRYRYSMKVRAYMMMGENEKAAVLIERLGIYYREYGRIYYRMENELLKAIVQFRMGEGDWKATLLNVLPEIEEYHFIYIIGREGAAIRPLFTSIKSLPVEEQFEKDIRKAVDTMAANYPGCLKVHRNLTVQLSDMEHRVLNCYCNGLKPANICELLCITNNTLKTHTGNVYRKLGVHNRTDAVRLAKEMNI